MPSVMAIVSQAVFEKCGPWQRTPDLGDVWDTSRYASKHPALATLEDGGDLYLVTVRPPGALWLVAVLRAPKRDAKGYRAAPNTVPIEDLGLLRSKLRFANGKPLPTQDRALAMSLQTPRVLAAEDVALIEGAPPMRPLKPAERRKRDQLLAMVYADPTNRDLRLVCADGLLELGDPRGELITVQARLAETPADEMLRIRERQLLKTHASTWLGPIAPFIRRCHRYRFEYGFLAEVLITSAIRETIVATKADPVWSTVRSHDGPLDLALAPAMRALREIAYDGVNEEGGGSPAWRRLLVDGRWPFECVDYTVGSVDPRGALTALASSKALPALRRLCIYNQRLFGATPAERLAAIEHLTPLYTGDILSQLEQLELVFGIPAWELARDWAARMRPLFDAARVPTLVIQMSGDDPPTITLRAEAGHYRHAEVEAGAPLPSNFANQAAAMEGVLAILPAVPKLRRITVVKRPKEGRRVLGDAKLVRALKALGRSSWTIT